MPPSPGGILYTSYVNHEGISIANDNSRMTITLKGRLYMSATDVLKIPLL